MVFDNSGLPLLLRALRYIGLVPCRLISIMSTILHRVKIQMPALPIIAVLSKKIVRFGVGEGEREDNYEVELEIKIRRFNLDQ
jgi:hypothetical protein